MWLVHVLWLVHSVCSVILYIQGQWQLVCQGGPVPKHCPLGAVQYAGAHLCVEREGGAYGVYEHDNVVGIGWVVMEMGGDGHSNNHPSQQPPLLTYW